MAGVPRAGCLRGGRLGRSVPACSSVSAADDAQGPGPPEACWLTASCSRRRLGAERGVPEPGGRFPPRFPCCLGGAFP